MRITKNRLLPKFRRQAVFRVQHTMDLRFKIVFQKSVNVCRLYMPRFILGRQLAAVLIQFQDGCQKWAGG